MAHEHGIATSGWARLGLPAVRQSVTALGQEADLRDQVSVILAGRPPVLSGDQGREILRFALAGQEAARSGTTVRL